MRVAVLLAVAGCHFTGTYTCAQDSQCTRNGQPGTCEATGHCAFPDTSCPSGERYDNSAGSFASQCVGAGDGGVDAAPGFVQINLGGPMFVGSEFPGTWTADPMGTTCPGSLPYTTTAPINGTVDDTLFQSDVFATNGALHCAIAGLPAKTYRVTLLFAEIYCGCPGFPACENKFSVALEGTTVGTIDLTNEGGGCALDTGPGHPFAHSYTVTVSDGTLNLDTMVQQHDSVLSAIAVAPTP